MRALFGQVARRLFVLDHAEFQPGVRHAVQAEHLHRDRRPGFLEPLALLADERADAAVKFAAQNDVADAQRAFADQHRRRRAARLDAGFDDVALGAAVGVRLEFQQFGLEQNHFQQLVHALFGERGNVHENRVAAPVVRHESLVLQLLADFQRVRVRMIHFVDGDEDRNFRGLGVVERLDGLRHDAVVRRHDQHDDVGDVRAAGAHGAERGVAGRVEERDLRQFLFAFRDAARKWCRRRCAA